MLARRERDRPNAFWIVTAAVASVVGWPAVAQAQAQTQEGTVGIAWTAPAECPTASDLEAAIRDLLGQPPHLADGRRLEVKARAERKPDRRWSATIETRLGTAMGSRTVATESCRAAADATALIVALMIDPDAVAARAAAPASPPPAAADAAVHAPAPPAPETASETAVSSPPPPSRPRLAPRLSLGPTMAVDVGTLPQPGYAAGARIAVKLGRSALELGVLASSSASATISGTAPPAGGSFRFLAGSLAACPAAGLGRRLDLGACAELELTEVKGTGFGVTSSYQNDARWLALGGGGLLRLRLTRHVAIPFRVDALAPLARTTFFLNGVSQAQGRVYTPSRVVMRALLAVDVDF
jgi:hypothetical protein